MSRKKAPPADLELEPSPSKPGLPPDAVLTELMALKQDALDAASNYLKAVATQAEKYKCKGGALKKYISACLMDRVAEARVELNDLERLLDSLPAVAATDAAAAKADDGEAHGDRTH
jgi:hypothetical protein